MVAIVLAQVMTQKFGGDSLEDMRASYNDYMRRVGERTAQVK